VLLLLLLLQTPQLLPLLQPLVAGCACAVLLLLQLLLTCRLAVQPPGLGACHVTYCLAGLQQQLQLQPSAAAHLHTHHHWPPNPTRYFTLLCSFSCSLI
jgi:hypothetical protein